ncbi:MAG: hypothetical protein AAGB28_05955 [Pseudomonadota bacterium]
MISIKSLVKGVFCALAVMAAALVFATGPSLATDAQADCAVFEESGYQVAMACDCNDPWAGGGWCFQCCLHGIC